MNTSATHEVNILRIILNVVPLQAVSFFSMDYELDIRLEALNLVSRENVLRGSQNNCLFQAYADFVKNCQMQCSAFKSYADDDMRAGVLRGRSVAK
jgi:hypothetical protein